jgi:repressor LexA
LEKNGYIRCHNDIARGIELIDRSFCEKYQYRVPVIGNIAAGKPIPVPYSDTWGSSSYSDSINVTGDLTRGKQGIYALRVKGWSMVDALVSDGDIVLVEYVSAVDNGEVAVIWLREEQKVTLKKFYAEDGRIRLQPANSRMKAMCVKPDNVEVQGRVITVIRQFGD